MKESSKWSGMWWSLCCLFFAGALALDKLTIVALSSEDRTVKRELKVVQDFSTDNDLGAGASSDKSVQLALSIFLVACVVAGTGVVWLASRRWKRPPRQVQAVALKEHVTLSVTDAARSLDIVHVARVMAALVLALWLLPPLSCPTDTFFLQFAMAVICGTFVYFDLPRNGPLAFAALLIVAANGIASVTFWLTGVLGALGPDVSVLNTVGFNDVAVLIVAFGAWKSWRLSRVSEPLLSRFPLSVGDAALVRPGWFASRKYLQVSFWSFVIGFITFLRFVPMLFISPFTGSFMSWRYYTWTRNTPLSANQFRRRRARASSVLAEYWQLRDARDPILLIRSFVDDATPQNYIVDDHRVPMYEDGLIEALWAYAPVITLGNPTDQEPQPGALRTFMRESHSADDGWRLEFERMATRAPMIIAFIGATPGLLWELNRIFELGLIDKLVLLVPAFDANVIESRWKDVQTGLATSSNGPYSALDQIECEDLLAMFRLGEHWVFLRAKDRSKSAYQIALRIAAQLLPFPDVLRTNNTAIAKCGVDDSDRHDRNVVSA